MIRATPSLNSADVKRAVKELNAIDKEIMKTMRKELRAQLGSIRTTTAKEHPKQIGKSVLRGFNHGGETAFTPIRSGIAFATKKPRDKAWKSIVAIEIKPQTRGAYIAELAGSRTAGITPQGRNLVNQLNKLKGMQGRGGRFYFDRFMRQRSAAIEITMRVLDRFMKQVNGKLK